MSFKNGGLQVLRNTWKIKRELNLKHLSHQIGIYVTVEVQHNPHRAFVGDKIILKLYF